MPILQIRIDTYFLKHFVPYEDFHKFSEKDKKTFSYCHRSIHGLLIFHNQLQNKKPSSFVMKHQGTFRKSLDNIRQFITKEGVQKEICVCRLD